MGYRRKDQGVPEEVVYQNESFMLDDLDVNKLHALRLGETGGLLMEIDTISMSTDLAGKQVKTKCVAGINPSDFFSPRVVVLGAEFAEVENNSVSMQLNESLTFSFTRKDDNNLICMLT